MLTLGSRTAEMLLPDEIAARVQRLTSDFPSLLTHSGFEKRIERAQNLVTRGEIIEVSPGRFRIQSESNPQGFYYVDTTKKSCTCPDAGKHPERPCKHRLAVALYVGWFNQEQPAQPRPQLRRNYEGWIKHPDQSRLMIKVRIIALDAPANLVTVRVIEKDSTGQAYRPFYAANADNGRTSCAILTPDQLKNEFAWRPDTEENILHDLDAAD